MIGADTSDASDDSDTSDASDESSSEDAIFVEGVISTVLQVVIDGNSHFYVMLEDDANIYDFALPDMVGILAYEEGDSVEFTCVQGDKVFTVQSFGDTTT